jgi:hypothetical protein
MNEYKVEVFYGENLKSTTIKADNVRCSEHSYIFRKGRRDIAFYPIKITSVTLI